MRYIICGILSICALAGTTYASSHSRVSIKEPGRKATEHSLIFDLSGTGKASDGMALPLTITKQTTTKGDVTDITYTITALEACRFNISDTIPTEMDTENCDFYMPGFWYHRNLRSPKGAPSFNEADSWSVREDRLSTPLTGIFDKNNKKGVTILRTNVHDNASDCVSQHLSGEVILPSATTIGSIGFHNGEGKASLVFGFPYTETPKRYIRKLTLIDPVTAFMTLRKGETVTLKWQLKNYKADDYSDFVADVWNYSFDTMSPRPLDNCITPGIAKKCMSDYFCNSFVDKYNLKYFSGLRMRTDDCANTDAFQVGFVGRTLLNALNAKEYGESTGNNHLIKMADDIFASVLENGFTPKGYFREDVRFNLKKQSDVLSIRRQSEGAYAILSWLSYERSKGRQHKEWEAKMTRLLDNMVALQNADGSFPRKFKEDGMQVDSTGGSTPSATLPLAIAHRYFKNKNYLESSRKTGDYLEKYLIDKADYFSSTLDANCEDKEASLYAATAMFYLSQITKGKERERYLDQCRKASYFCLSWYYMWDVPFAPGQMLGDVGFKSRGWGNVSVENNHIDVFIFDFATVLDKLSAHYSEPRFSAFADVIKTSMLQLMPMEDDMYEVAKAGYYPEVIQHTTWDYGKNGKGFYNDIFAPGWTVASLWQMLSPERIDSVFKNS